MHTDKDTASTERQAKKTLTATRGSNWTGGIGMWFLTTGMGNIPGSVAEVDI